MYVTIYQISSDRDSNRVMFMELASLEKLQGLSEVNSEIYDKVFEGDVNCENLEDIYRMFNIDQPTGYKGRSLSVSDVVEVTDEEGNSKFYFCDTIGFAEITFDASLTEDFKEPKIKVVLCEPGKVARITEIANTLENLQATVGDGLIEPFYPFEEAVCIICNEEGKFNGMEPNRAVYGEDKEILDVVFGPFFICDCSGAYFGSLNEEQLKKYQAMFKNPEKLISVNGKIMSIPYDPSK